MKYELTKTDLKILKVMWESNEPLSYGKIIEKEPTLNSNTVQAQLRKLLKKELIRVADVGYSGTVLCRLYEPVITAEELATVNYLEELTKIKKRPAMSDLVCALLDMEGSKKKKMAEIEELKKMLDKYKRGL